MTIETVPDCIGVMKFTRMKDGMDVPVTEIEWDDDL